MDMEAGKTLTNEEVIRELLELLKKNAMKEQANDVFEICSYVDGLEKKIDSMTEELTNMQNQIKEMQEDTLVNNAKKALSEAQEQLNARCEQIKSQVLEVKAQVKSTAKSIVDEAKAKGRAALYRVSEFLGIKKKLLDIRENVRGAIKTTDKDIAKMAEDVEKVDHVVRVVSYASFSQGIVPVGLLPDRLKDAFANGDARMMAVFYDTTISADETLQAVEDVRAVAGDHVYVGGMSAIVIDTKNLSDKEIPAYIAIAAVLCLIILISYLVCFFLYPLFVCF